MSRPRTGVLDCGGWYPDNPAAELTQSRPPPAPAPSVESGERSVTKDTPSPTSPATDPITPAA
ncbi:hypothetical protein [Streptomyces koyangensis]|uniref:hypothetical protein n=1 Tax=Streptomyces koyangensis TaxID=188770 RepID=UPI00339B06A3|nr:hypothetical protein OH717_30570 [Streptomyces albidoflavus]